MAPFNGLRLADEPFAHLAKIQLVLPLVQAVVVLGRFSLLQDFRALFDVDDPRDAGRNAVLALIDRLFHSIHFHVGLGGVEVARSVPAR